MKLFYDNFKTQFGNGKIIFTEKGVRKVILPQKKAQLSQTEVLKSPPSPRAIGQVLSKNPCPIIIPCHRVVGKDGSLKGFQAGLGWKRILINLEKGGSAWESRE